jgi:glucose-1-phosphate cytidylyltransferase
VLSGGGRTLELLSSDIHDWRITFVDTGLTSNIGQRLKAVEPHLQDEEVFLANYTDGLSDVDLNALVKKFLRSKKLACFVSVKPKASFHMITVDGDDIVKSIDHIAKFGARINGGFFVLRREIFQYMKPGDELVEEPFRRLIAEGQLISHPHDGFWACMDTFKEMQELEDLYGRGNAPWTVWNGPQLEKGRMNGDTLSHPVPLPDPTITVG